MSDEWCFSYYDQNGNKHEQKGLVDKQKLISEFVEKLDYLYDNTTFYNDSDQEAFWKIYKEYEEKLQ